MTEDEWIRRTEHWSLLRNPEIGIGEIEEFSENEQFI